MSGSTTCDGSDSTPKDGESQRDSVRHREGRHLGDDGLQAGAQEEDAKPISVVQDVDLERAIRGEGDHDLRALELVGAGMGTDSGQDDGPTGVNAGNAARKSASEVVIPRR